MGILTTLILPIHEQGISSHLFVLSSISFISVSEFSEYRSFISLVKCIPRYFIPFDAIINRIVFLNSLSSSLLLVYRKATDFCYMLILYPEILLDSLIDPISFLVKTLGFSICSMQRVTVLLPLFQFGWKRLGKVIRGRRERDKGSIRLGWQLKRR